MATFYAPIICLMLEIVCDFAEYFNVTGNNPLTTPKTCRDFKPRVYNFPEPYKIVYPFCSCFPIAKLQVFPRVNPKIVALSIVQILSTSKWEVGNNKPNCLWRLSPKP